MASVALFEYLPWPSSPGAPTYTMNESSGAQLAPQPAGGGDELNVALMLMKLPATLFSGSLSYQPAIVFGLVPLLFDIFVRYRNETVRFVAAGTNTSRYNS